MYRSFIYSFIAILSCAALMCPPPLSAETHCISNSRLPHGAFETASRPVSKRPVSPGPHSEQIQASPQKDRTLLDPLDNEIDSFENQLSSFSCPAWQKDILKTYLQTARKALSRKNQSFARKCLEKASSFLKNAEPSPVNMEKHIPDGDTLLDSLAEMDAVLEKLDKSNIEVEDLWALSGLAYDLYSKNKKEDSLRVARFLHRELELRKSSSQYKKVQQSTPADKSSENHIRDGINSFSEKTARTAPETTGSNFVPELQEGNPSVNQIEHLHPSDDSESRKADFLREMTLRLASLEEAYSRRKNLEGPLPEAERLLELARGALESRDFETSLLYMKKLETGLLSRYITSVIEREISRSGIKPDEWTGAPAALLITAPDLFSPARAGIELSKKLDYLRPFYEGGARTFIFPGPDLFTDSTYYECLRNLAGELKKTFPGIRLILLITPFETLLQNTHAGPDIKSYLESLPSGKFRDSIARAIDRTPLVHIFETDESQLAKPGSVLIRLSPNSEHVKSRFKNLLSQLQGVIDGLWLAEFEYRPFPGKKEDTWASLDTLSIELFSKLRGLPPPEKVDWADDSFREWVTFRISGLAGWLEEMTSAFRHTHGSIILEIAHDSFPSGTARALDLTAFSPRADAVVAGAAFGDGYPVPETPVEWLTATANLRLLKGITYPSPLWVLPGDAPSHILEAFYLSLLMDGISFVATDSPAPDMLKLLSHMNAYSRNTCFSSRITDVYLLHVQESIDFHDALFRGQEEYSGELTGLAMCLTLLNLQFETVKPADLCSLPAGSTLLLPDPVAMSSSTRKAVTDFASRGGQLLIFGRAGIEDGRGLILEGEHFPGIPELPLHGTQFIKTLEKLSKLAAPLNRPETLAEMLRLQEILKTNGVSQRLSIIPQDSGIIASLRYVRMDTERIEIHLIDPTAILSKSPARGLTVKLNLPPDFEPGKASRVTWLNTEPAPLAYNRNDRSLDFVLELEGHLIIRLEKKN